MATGLLHLHSVLRWIILVLLLLNIFNLFKGNVKINVSKYLLIFSHITLLIGLYQYYFSETVGLKILLEQKGSFSAILSDSFSRFWAVEHLSGMIISIALITIGHIRLKKSGKASNTAILYSLALIIMLAVIPWPGREGIGRPIFPGM
jgi:hypothetical protein